MIKKAFLYPLLAVSIITSCNTTSEKKTVETKTVSKPKVVKKEFKFEKISDENVEIVLTEYGKFNKAKYVTLKTRLGDIKIELYEDTPLHRANFLMLSERYFKGTQFYRVIKDFVVQGGDTDDFSYKGKKRKIGGYTIPHEINRDKHIHKRGALAAARDYEDNPSMRTSPYDFYFVQGVVYNEEMLKHMEKEENIRVPQKDRKTYTTLGGTPHLDGQHTVFGEVVEGLDVIEKISKEKVSDDNWPIEEVIIEDVIIHKK
ncbi:peptidylprolyl isomerase [Sediminitomix flava]|uniref:peptidylprolyl isomerase n=1 Tax=Sediminitomix flava TaxID=379075 RepID=A0A315ZE73_SEDFL|nr:peptidylprolyl isomerase [Sediminitomix flava]PWJ43831.1 peptidyl-prolyl cis-trans isomerase B (cyclophilin B) [Sediminitomix flava]